MDTFLDNIRCILKVTTNLRMRKRAFRKFYNFSEKAKLIPFATEVLLYLIQLPFCTFMFLSSILPLQCILRKKNILDIVWVGIED